MRSGVRHSPRRTDHSIMAAVMTMPSASTNTGSVVSTRQPPHDSTTSPVWSAIQAAPAAAAAIRNRNRMIRIMKFLLAGWRERGHGVAGVFARGRKRGVAGVGLAEPILRGGAIGGRKRIQFTPRLAEIVAQRRRRNARDDTAAIGADGIGALDTHELCSAGLQPIDYTAAGGLIVGG